MINKEFFSNELQNEYNKVYMDLRNLRIKLLKEIFTKGLRQIIEAHLEDEALCDAITSMSNDELKTFLENVVKAEKSIVFEKKKTGKKKKSDADDNDNKENTAPKDGNTPEKDPPPSDNKTQNTSNGNSTVNTNNTHSV